MQLASKPQANGTVSCWEQPQVCCPGGDVHPSSAIKLSQNAVDVHLDGTWADAQGRGDLAFVTIAAAVFVCVALIATAS